MTDPARDLDLIDARLLPPQMRMLVATIGVAETLQLLEHRGGIPTYIAEDPAQSVLRAILRPESVVALSKRFGRQTLDLPKPDKLRQQLRDHYIREARRQGLKSGRQLAREFSITWRRVKQICVEQETDGESPTADLFA
jgi:hypothetical protein